MTDQDALYPSAATLSAWSDRDWKRADGVQLDQLERMQRLIVRTYQHAYEIFVRCGASGDVLVRGGRMFQDFTEATLVGSSMGGGVLKQFGVYVGLRVEFNIDGETVLTAPIFRVSICPIKFSATA